MTRKVTKLPFIKDRPTTSTGKQYKGSRCFWYVKPTGDYGEDCSTGNQYALAYLRFQAAEGAAGSGGILWNIISDMPRAGKSTGIEIGFCSIINFAATEGLHEAERLSAYWAECSARRKAA